MPIYFAGFNIAADHFSYFRDSAYSQSATSCQAFFREVVDVANFQCAMRSDETVKHRLQQPKVLFNDPSGDPRLEKRSILMVSSHLQEDHPFYLPVRIQPRNNDHVPKYIPGNERFSIQSILGLEQSTSQNTLVANPQLDSEQLQRDTSPAGNELDDKATVSGSDESLTSTHEDDCESEELKAVRKAYAQSERKKAYQRAYQKAYRQSEKGKARRRAWAQSEKGKACARSWKRRAYQQAYRQSSKGKAYEQSEKRKAYLKAYEQTEKRKAYLKAYEQTEKRKAYRKAYLKAYEQTEKRKAYRKAYLKAYEQTEKRKAYRKAYNQSERVKAFQKVYQRVYQKSYRQTEKGRAYQKAYRESPQGRAYLKAYRNAYNKVLRVTGDIEQARIAGRQATVFLKESNKANNNEPFRE